MVFTALAVVAALAGQSGAPPVRMAPTVPELGRVRFRRGYDDARAAAAVSGRPVAVLFDEVPGCSTVRGYGEDVLSDPFVVDALETLFVPVFVQNNAGPADDAAVLHHFNEPGWNNPVFRVVDARGHELAPRLTRLSSGALFQTLVTALVQAKRPVPPWLAVLADEGDAHRLETAVVQTACFWQGEADLGGVDGVRQTTAGFQNGAEVVRVQFDPKAISREALTRAARRHGHTVQAKSDGFRVAPASDDKRHLKASPYAGLSLTGAQATRINAALAAGEDPRRFLAPHQFNFLGGAQEIE